MLKGSEWLRAFYKNERRRTFGDRCPPWELCGCKSSKLAVDDEPVAALMSQYGKNLVILVDKLRFILKEPRISGYCTDSAELFSLFESIKLSLFFVI